MSRRKYLKNLLRLILVTALFLSACNLFSHLPKPLATVVSTQSQEGVTPGVTQTGSEHPAGATDTPQPSVRSSQGPRFAVYEESPGEVTPLINHDALAADLSNVQNPFLLSAGQITRLAQNGFVVSPSDEKEFFALYEKARYDNVPIFVTSDSLLHSYHLLFDKVLRVAEVEKFIPLLKELNRELLAESDRQYQSLKGTPWEDPAMRLVAYFGVASKLLDPGVQIPDYAAGLAELELGNISQAAGILPSPLFPGYEFGEDYTQYIPRGHYTKSEDLKRYFQAMMWYGRMTFRLRSNNPEIGKAETRSALLLTSALHKATVNGQPAQKAWADLYAPTTFFVGRSDDLTPVQYQDVMAAVYGSQPDLTTITDETKLAQFIDLAYQLPPPKILGMVISVNEDEVQTTKGLRFMGQRFVPDAYIFRELIYRNVGTPEKRRGLPKGLDLMAAMGSERAYQLLEQLGETSYERYPSQMEKVRSWLKDLTVPEWTETLYNTWLYSFYPLLEIPGEGYPKFMRSQAWLDKQLNTSLGSWAELKHDTILYAKQVYAEMGGGPPPPPPLPPRNYVEPVPQFYARLAALTAMTRTGLESRGLLSDADREGLGSLEDLARAFQHMAEKELRGEPLTEDENEKIRYYGGDLEHLVILSADMDTQEEGVGTPVGMEEDQQAAVISDVATDPDPTGDGAGQAVVQEEGVGRIFEIYAVAPIVAADGSIFLQVNRGGVFSYYEFAWPANDRLTDEKWRGMLEDGTAPDLPAWTNSFMVLESGYDSLRAGVASFQNNLVNQYWDPVNSVGAYGPTFDMYTPELQALNANKQYIGKTLVSSYFRSFDLQSPTRAVVTVRETWRDELFNYTGDMPFYEEAVAAARGPYVMDVTYTLEFVQEPSYSYWEVNQVVYNSSPPGW